MPSVTVCTEDIALIFFLFRCLFSFRLQGLLSSCPVSLHIVSYSIAQSLSAEYSVSQGLISQ